ncbi:MAG: class I SAM-dependent methyltransferase [Asgard group archaeon]|nr:class I SAM-dependent methyltransferase [Asgard group archaeon]
MSKDYYSEKLSSNKLKRCYDIASPRIKQYLEAEIQFVLDQIDSSDIVLELGCGYGRVLARLAKKAKAVYGIDISEESIDFAEEFLAEYSNNHLYQMDAEELTFQNNSFNVVVAIQNAVSAFKIAPERLIVESLRVTKPNGKVILSSYSEKIWDARLDWFAKQSEENLLGEIDWEKTKDGIIICKDGFKATTFTQKDFQDLIEKLDLNASITEVDNSSLFCVIKKA